MRMRNLVLVMIVLIAASALAMAADPGNPEAGRPEDAGPEDPEIQIVNNTVYFNNFSPDSTDTWEITVSWEEGRDKVPYESGPHFGTLDYIKGSKSYTVVFFTEETEQPPETLNSAIIELPSHCHLNYVIDIKTYDEAGTLILNTTGILDLN